MTPFEWRPAFPLLFQISEFPLREQDYSTVRVSRFRRHTDGDHSECNYNGRCDTASELWQLNEDHLFAVAVFAELDRRGIDALAFFGDGYGHARELADADLPDYDYLPREPDSVHRIQAQRAVRHNLKPDSRASEGLWLVAFHLRVAI